MSPTILIVEDDAGVRTSLEKSMKRRGYDVHAVATVGEAKAVLVDRDVDLVLADMKLPDGSGLEVLAHAREAGADTVVVVVTAFPDMRSAVHAMREGAHDFIVKPFELDELHLCVERALEAKALRRDVRRLERESRRHADEGEILGESAAIAVVRDQIRKVAEADTPVLVVGETGTGKELVADSIRRQSRRAGGPLVKVNCSAFSEQLLESELFGHEKGAYTDAKEAREGLFEMAEGGTLFLDEIAEMKPGLQAKLLRVVEGQPFHRVGGRREIRTDVRIIAATNKDVPSLIRNGGFREDLYFRLNVFRIVVPPLRDRGADVVLLARSFLDRSAASLGKGPLRFSPDVERMLLDYPWPGNVRELRNVMERAAILCGGDEVGLAHVPVELQAESFIKRTTAAGQSTAIPTLEEIERRYVAHVVALSGGNLSEAARTLGIARNTLKARLAGEPR
jgi:DNA-binding NtrC family response regulator